MTLLELLRFDREKTIDPRQQRPVISVLQVSQVLVQTTEQKVHFLGLKGLEQESVVCGKEEEGAGGTSSFSGLEDLLVVEVYIKRVVHHIVAESI